MTIEDFPLLSELPTRSTAKWPYPDLKDIP